MSGCIYLIRNNENGKHYVGQTRFTNPMRRFSVHLNSSRNGSTYALHAALRKYPIDIFTVETLCLVPYSALNNMESYFAEQYSSYVWDSPGGYNMVWCGGSKVARCGIKMPDTTKAAILSSRTGSKHTDASKQRMSAALKGRVLSPETIAKSAASRIGRKLSDETRAKISEKARGRIITTEQRAKISATLTGRPGHKHSEETRLRMSERMLGNKLSDESIAKMIETKKARSHK
jgi:group I intron endonuclease